jgi:uncharacterized protein (DUF2249 family)
MTTRDVEERGTGAPRKPEVPESCRTYLDVRDDIRRGEEPFARIMAVVKALEPGHVLVLRAPFEPIPLYDVLAKRGFAHWTEREAPDDWAVWFYRTSGGADASAEAAATTPQRRVGRTLAIDVRGLEPPQPMVRILEAIDGLSAGDRLEILHERRPIFLYPQLEDRGFLHETSEPAPGLVRIVIRRRDL